MRAWAMGMRETAASVELDLLHNGRSSLSIVIGKDGALSTEARSPVSSSISAPGAASFSLDVALFAAPLAKSNRVDLDSHGLSQSILRHYPTRSERKLLKERVYNKFYNHRASQRAVTRASSDFLQLF